MGNEIAWRVEVAVEPGQLENFRALTAEMVAFTRAEPGVLSYQRFITDDGRIVHVYERYADSAAALAHLQTFASKFAERFSSMVERKHFTVYGNPSPALKALLDGFGATYLRALGDLAYW